MYWMSISQLFAGNFRVPCTVSDAGYSERNTSYCVKYIPITLFAMYPEYQQFKDQNMLLVLVKLKV